MSLRIRTLVATIAIVLAVPVGASAQMPSTLAASPSTAAAPERGSGFSPSTQAASQQLWEDLYLDVSDGAIGWTGSTASCTAGTTTQAFKDGVLNRINYFRAMAGVPDDITFNATYNTKAQAAALIMGANQALNHHPPPDWACYTAAGDEGASHSNLARGVYGAASINAYMQDAGTNNTFVGHRRWILYPQTEQMGTGDTTSSPFTTNSLWVFDHIGSPRPTTREGYVAWPPPGFVPHPVVYPRWSFAYPGADFTNAAVTMTRNGTPISAPVNSSPNGYGENTTVWEPVLTAPQLAAPAVYNITVSQVVIGGNPQSFTYQVTAFDPDTTDPTVDLRTPPAGAVYAQGQAVTADFSCADNAGGSGLASCLGTVADGAAVDTATIGSHQFTVTATDKAGNTAQRTHSYTVAPRQPDGRIKQGTACPTVGDNIYNADGAGQTCIRSAGRGAALTYTITLQNDGPWFDQLRLKGTRSTAGFAVRYTSGGFDITAAVTQGTYTTTFLAPGATARVKATVTVSRTAPAGATLNATLIAKANTEPTRADTVRFITNRS